MKINKNKLIGIIKEEIEILSEVSYDEEGNPVYVKPVEGETTPDDAEVLITGRDGISHGGLEIQQIKGKIKRQLAELGKEGHSVSSALNDISVVKKYLETLELHSVSTLDPAMPEETDKESIGN